MVDRDILANLTNDALLELNLPELGEKTQGKVRDMYKQTREARDELILITTDRLSAFDRVLGAVPYKGQVLTGLSLFWFEKIKDIIGNYVIETPHPHVIIGYECEALPVEVIVRGYISGVTKTSLWYRYNLGERNIYGYDFPEGLKKNQPLPEAIITPTTKGGPTGKDERLTCAEVVGKGYLDNETWQKVQTAALEVFAKGQEVADKAGLILVDTKYEFGRLPNGEIVIIDEVHTPDSSRFWRKDSYEARFTAGDEPENFDKEFIRLWYAEQGYRGDGEPPAWNPQLAVNASIRYQTIYEMLTGTEFPAAAYPPAPDIQTALKHIYQV